MNEKLFSRISREKLEMYLDGSLNEGETAEVDRLLDEDTELQLLIDEYVKLQMQINNEALSNPQAGKTLRRNRLVWISVGAACCIALIVSLSLIFMPSDNHIPQTDDNPVFRGNDTLFDAHLDSMTVDRTDSI